MTQDNQRKKVVPNSKAWLEAMDAINNKEPLQLIDAPEVIRRKQLQKNEEKLKWKKFVELVVIPLVVTLVAAGIAKYLGWV